MTNPHANTAAAAFLKERMRDLKHRKSQKEIAQEAGFLNANMLSLLKSGANKIPLDRVPERGFDRDMAEMALAHQVGTEVERAYQRSDMLERRRAMMTAWAGFLGGDAGGANVVKLGAAG